MGFRFNQISKNLNPHFFNKYLMQKGYQPNKQMTEFKLHHSGLQQGTTTVNSLFQILYV